MQAEQKTSHEPLLNSYGRTAVIPVDAKYALIWDNIERQRQSFWTAKQIRFDEDIKNFPIMPKDRQRSTECVLGFFAGSDDIVGEIITTQFLPRIKNPEFLVAYTFEAMMEQIHSEVYNRTIMAVVNDNIERRNEILHAVETNPAVKLKADWAQQWISDKRGIDYSIVGKACVEGINFSASFAFIDWLKTQKYRLDGIYLANREISRDEARHVETGCIAHNNHIVDKISESEAKEIIDGAYEVEMEFVNNIIPEYGYPGMTRELMSAHVRHVCATLAADLGYQDLYTNTYCPFDFVKMRSFNSKANFFERDEGNYTKIVETLETGDDFDEAFNDDAEC